MIYLQNMKRSVELAQEKDTSRWLTVLPLVEHGGFKMQYISNMDGDLNP